MENGEEKVASLGDGFLESSADGVFSVRGRSQLDHSPLVKPAGVTSLLTVGCERELGRRNGQATRDNW